MNQEYIELDWFRNDLAKFSVKDFEDVGLNADDRFLIEFMRIKSLDTLLPCPIYLGVRTAVISSTYANATVWNSWSIQVVQLHLPLPNRSRVCRFLLVSIYMQTSYIRHLISVKATHFVASGTYSFLSPLNSRLSAQILLQAVRLYVHPSVHDDFVDGHSYLISRRANR